MELDIYKLLAARDRGCRYSEVTQRQRRLAKQKMYFSIYNGQIKAGKGAAPDDRESEQ